VLRQQHDAQAQLTLFGAGGRGAATVVVVIAVMVVAVMVVVTVMTVVPVMPIRDAVVVTMMAAVSVMVTSVFVGTAAGIIRIMTGRKFAELPITTTRRRRRPPRIAIWTVAVAIVLRTNSMPH
jgi:hypothetical protein